MKDKSRYANCIAKQSRFFKQKFNKMSSENNIDH